jgi:hypothetical protein
MLQKFPRVRIRRLLPRRIVHSEWVVVVIDYCSVSLDVIILISIAVTVAIGGTGSADTFIVHLDTIYVDLAVVEFLIHQ